MIERGTLHLSTGDVELKPITAPVPTLQSFYVLPDQFTYRWGFKVRAAAPCPAVFRTGEAGNTLSFQRSTFTREWQWFAAELLCLAAFGRRWAGLTEVERSYVRQKFTSVYHHAVAFCNFKGVDNCNNYVVGAMTGEDPKIDPLLCAGNVFEGAVAGGTPTVVAVRSFFAGMPPPEPDLADPRVQWATVIDPDGDLHNFAQLGGKPVPYVLLAAHQYYYELRETRTP